MQFPLEKYKFYAGRNQLYMLLTQRSLIWFILFSHNISTHRRDTRLSSYLLFKCPPKYLYHIKDGTDFRTIIFQANVYHTYVKDSNRFKY